MGNSHPTEDIRLAFLQSFEGPAAPELTPDQRRVIDAMTKLQMQKRRFCFDSGIMVSRALAGDWASFACQMEVAHGHIIPYFELCVTFNSPVLMNQILPFNCIALDILAACVAHKADRVLRWLIAYDSEFPEEPSDTCESRWAMYAGYHAGRGTALLKTCAAIGERSLIETLFNFVVVKQWFKESDLPSLLEGEEADGTLGLKVDTFALTNLVDAIQAPLTSALSPAAAGEGTARTGECCET